LIGPESNGLSELLLRSIIRIDFDVTPVAYLAARHLSRFRIWTAADLAHPLRDRVLQTRVIV
jgi:hypothetical protein